MAALEKKTGVRKTLSHPRLRISGLIRRDFTSFWASVSPLVGEDMVSVWGELRRRNVFEAAIRRYWPSSPLI